MVSTPASAWRLPETPASLGALLEATFALWLRSTWRLLPFALLYSLAGGLPLLTLGDLGTRLLQVAANIVVSAFDPMQPEPSDDPLALYHATVAWATAPATLALGIAAVLLALYAVSGLMLRQQAIAQGDDRGLAHAAILALVRLPAAGASWLLYTLAMVLCAALVLGFAALLFVYAFDVGVGGLLLLAVLFLAGSLLLSIPLAWASVAFGYAPVLATLAGTGPIATHVRSARLVRGHWVRAATAVTLPLLIYLGLGSTMSSIVYTLLGATVFATGGLAAVLEGRWLLWAPWLMALPMALCLPLAFAGFLTSLHDLEQGNPAPP